MNVIQVRAALLAGAALAAVLSGCATPAPPPPKPVIAAAPVSTCMDFSFPIYFEKGSDDLTASARTVVVDAAAQVKGCAIGKVEVLGLADADGAASRNLVLSRKRAAVVARRLAAAGLPGATFDIEAIGEAGALAADGKPDPMRRRTEVVIHMAAPAAK